MTTTSIVTVSTATQQMYHDVTQGAPYVTLRYMFTHAGYYCDLLSSKKYGADVSKEDFFCLHQHHKMTTSLTEIEVKFKPPTDIEDRILKQGICRKACANWRGE